ncbi:hypothetical protein [Rhizorhabdus argentea]|uniref:hypothetical protein n=1 Tax=Rhizorhabdus argentea TaxID=1387174 RepID=UPI0030EF223E
MLRQIAVRLYSVSRPYPLRSKYALTVACQRQSHIRRYRINGFALRAPIGMIDAVALIMAVQQSGAYKVRYRPAHIRPTGSQDARLDLLILLLSQIARIFRGVSVCHQLRPDRCNHGRAATVAIGQRRQCPAKPVAYRNLVGFASDIRSETAILSCRLRDQVEDEQHISRTFRYLRNALDKIWQRDGWRRHSLRGLLDMVKEVCLVEHSRNLAQAIPL